MLENVVEVVVFSMSLLTDTIKVKKVSGYNSKDTEYISDFVFIEKVRVVISKSYTQSLLTGEYTYGGLIYYVKGKSVAYQIINDEKVLLPNFEFSKGDLIFSDEFPEEYKEVIGTKIGKTRRGAVNHIEVTI